MNPRPLGYEPYDVRLCRPASSLVATLTSEDGRRAFVSGPLRLPRLKPSRRVLCTNPCTNLVTESLAVPAQMPGWEGVTVGPFTLPSNGYAPEALTSGTI